MFTANLLLYAIVVFSPTVGAVRHKKHRSPRSVPCGSAGGCGNHFAWQYGILYLLRKHGWNLMGRSP
jgi:hypothetical protein